MKKIFNKIKLSKVITFMLFFSFLVFTMCVTITGVNQPSTATVGDTIAITVDVSVDTGESSAQNVVFGVLAPTSWDVSSNATPTFTSDKGDSGTFRLANAGEAGFATTFETEYGIGENYGEVEWVVFVSNEQVTGVDGVDFTGQILLNLTVGNENIQTQLGYAVAAYGHVSSGNIGSFFPPCMEVSGGTNPLIDLCGPIPYPVQYEPSTYSTEDIIKITFDATKADNSLMGATQVYLCATAMVNGNPVQVCDNSAATMMNNLGDDMWDISIWARGLFNVTDDSPITDIMYSFKNEAGDIIVQDPNTMADFLIEDNCN